MKIFIALAIILTIGILLRWNTVVDDTKKAFSRFNKTEQSDSVK